MAKQVSSIRLRPDLKEQLDRHARETGTSAAALQERFIDEGLRREEHPLIVFRDGLGGRRAMLAGSRLSVGQVIDTVKATEATDDAARIRAAADYLDLPIGHVQASVRYYARYKDEVDAWLEQAANAAEREREAWLREQALFT
jgi:predicted transcriptional regulator